MENSLKALMERLSISKYPERWNGFFEEVSQDVLQNGCMLAERDYYQELHDNYGVLENLLDVFQEAADEIKADGDCLLFTALLSRAMKDRDKIRSDLASLDLPNNDPYTLKYAAIPSLVMCEAIPKLYAEMKLRNVPQDIFEATIKSIERVTENYMNKNNGEVGFSNFAWHQLLYDGRLFKVKRLTLEFPFALPGAYKVFENTTGEIVTLVCNMQVHRDGMPLGSLRYEDDTDSFTASLEETDDAYIGYPFDEHGKIKREKVTLKKDEWHVKLKGGDRVVSIHIPRGGDFDDKTVQETLDYARVFLDKCYPDYENKAFFCASWLLDHQIGELLGNDSNIVKFGNRYRRMHTKNPGTDAITFVFNVNDKKYTLDDLNELPENTRLERTLKKHYLDGKAIYMPHGFFF